MRVGELGRGAGLLGQGGVASLGLVLGLELGLLLLVARQAKEKPQNGLQIPIPDLCLRRERYREGDR